MSIRIQKRVGSRPQPHRLPESGLSWLPQHTHVTLSSERVKVLQHTNGRPRRYGHDSSLQTLDQSTCRCGTLTATPMLYHSKASSSSTHVPPTTPPAQFGTTVRDVCPRLRRDLVAHQQVPSERHFDGTPVAKCPAPHLGSPALPSQLYGCPLTSATETGRRPSRTCITSCSCTRGRRTGPGCPAPATPSACGRIPPLRCARRR